MKRVGEKVVCRRTLELVRKAISAGHLDPKTGALVQGKFGTPQGSVLSPFLSNIVLHELDKFIGDLKAEFDAGTKRRPNPKYVKLNSKRRNLKDIRERRKVLREMRSLMASDPMDANFKRLKYVRYADDFVILVIGSQEDTLKIRDKVKNFIANKCGLELNLEKTLITNFRKEGFKFLGTDCRKVNMTQNHVVKLKQNVSVRATTRLRVNIDLKKVYKALVSSGIAKWDENNPQVPRGTAKNVLINSSHADIVAFFNSKARGLVSFYSFAGNRKRLNLVL